MNDPRQVIRAVQVTEKGTLLGEHAQYMIQVATEANKIEIKQAVEKLFDVKVRAVNTQRYTGKTKRSRTRRPGKRPDWKRAIVTLQAGQSIELV